MNFTKMQGLGNDYIYFNCFTEKIENPEELSIKLSDRHFGIGGDGIVMILPSTEADFKMRMFNADGSEGKMCGNAIRCIGKYVYDRGLTDKTELKIETLSGIKTLNLHTSCGKVKTVTVDMGAPELVPEKIPVSLSGAEVISVPLNVGGNEYKITCVSMGNPHCIVFCDNPFGMDIEAVGPLFESHKIFPERINTEFVKVINKNKIEMRVWERGSGETLACGTGACASVVACVLNGFCDINTDVEVVLKGGSLKINYTGSTVLMTGTADFSFDGTLPEQEINI